ncbi:hypothetical protein B484DRAFT_456818 [Ochromonadaceae sp. CCMP2298]|nr:hypothetical protein B484DRAFT_456818 [Ochromonadaceae sp. CCMP2298]
MAICDDAKILINVHQTYWHHTLEEFRVLPSLQRGVIVVSEWVPAIETIPFHEYMIFAPYEELVATVAEVLGNYSHYHERIFGPKSGLGALLRDMRARARQQLESRVLKVASMKPSEIEANRVTFFREGVLVKGAGASIYQIRNSSRCEFESASTFAAQGHEFGQELFVHDVYIAKLPLIGYC